MRFIITIQGSGYVCRVNGSISINNSLTILLAKLESSMI